MENRDIIKINGVYYLESMNAHMNPIAIRPQINLLNRISWEDTSHGRSLHCSKILVNGEEIKAKKSGIPERIEVTSENGKEKYVFVLLTRALFNAKLKDNVAGGSSLNFENDEEVQEYYLNTDFYSAG